MTLRVKAIYLSILSVALVLILISGCQPNKNDATSEETTPLTNNANEVGSDDPSFIDPPDSNAPQVKEPERYTKQATLTAVGDIMMHLPQTYSGYHSEDRTYNFDSFFSEVSERLSAGNWVIGNLETPLVDEDPRGYTGFPEFNAPPELADALKKAGFNILTTANNHSLDRRERGVLRTLEHVKERDIAAIGTAATPEDAAYIHVVTHEDIAMAFLAYTYGTNGIPIPEGKDHLVNLIDEQKIIADIQRAKELQPDLITVSLHFGNEYQSKPTDAQQQLAHALIRAGADIILGSHPHVLQPYEWVEVDLEDGTSKQGIIIYSMGNFVSNQDRSRNNNHPTEIGVIFEIDIRKQFPEGQVELTEVRATPTYVDKGLKDGKQQYRVLMLDEILAERKVELWSGKAYEQLEAYYQTALSSLASMSVPVQVETP
jgi:poly-gamma-glutamate capsule biosynthesis protein CapA/YwtB (metallophosphatase superfamily)